MTKIVGDVWTIANPGRDQSETDWARLLVDGEFPPTYVMVIGDGETELH